MQLPLFDLGNLRDEAKRRGLDNLGLFACDPWETLDREEIFVPVAYARHGMWNHNQLECLEDGDLVIREEIGYRPWAELREEAEERYGDRGDPQVLYHHWQLLWLGELQKRMTPAVAWGNLGDSLETFYEVRAKMASVPDPTPRDALRTLAVARRARELMLIRVQNMFFPFERGDPRQSNWIASPVSGLTENAADWAGDQLESLDYSALADDCGVSADDLTGIYHELVHYGLEIDPTSALFDLIDQLRRSSRDRLKGAARQAVDYYDAARVIRSWQQRLTGEWLPDIDEHRGINGQAFKQRHYGTLDVRGNRALLPIVLEDHGLYPWRVQLIGEGDSEIAALRLILEKGYGLSFETLGIAVTDMGGADIPAKAERLLGAMRGYANYFLLVFDNEGKARELIDTLRRAKVIGGVSDQQRKAILTEATKAVRQIDDPNARNEALRAARERASKLDEEPGAAPEFVLWRENFEADNFSPAEMYGVIARYARNDAEIADFALAQSDIEAALRQGRNGERAIASVILELAEEKDARFRLSKPDFARLLAHHALDHPERDGKTRPLIELAEHLIQLTWADRRLAGELRGS